LGHVHVTRDRVVRVVQAEAVKELDQFLALQQVHEWVEQGRLIATKKIGSAMPGLVEYEHPRIPFPSFPHEWPPEMLHRAAELTLVLAEGSIKLGYGLKDATPMNVLFKGVQPVFIDVLSFEAREKTDPIWLPAAQFERTFLIPLLAWKHLRIPPHELLMVHRDGIGPEEANSWFRGMSRFGKDFISLVKLPAALTKRAKSRDSEADLQNRKNVTEEVASFVLRSTIRRLNKLLTQVAPGQAQTKWHDYMQTHSYDSESFKAKEKFVEDALKEIKPKTALDIGCNTGHFSHLAAKHGASVVAIDSDLGALDEVCRSAVKSKADILPLAVDITRPTPATGWLNSEQSSFLERAHGAFDLVLMLAVIHHMQVTERIPLDQVLKLARDLTRDSAVIEYVSPQDPMFKSISVARGHLFTGLTEANFEEVANRYFEVVRSIPLNNGLRRLYLLKGR
jgi:2-polyprenyl-3-methyl-5-hydroxy-6-metoxy-1,4-benzoquinol methylase